MLASSDPLVKEAALAAQVGASLATLAENNANFAITIENILYNLTLLYGKDLGQHLLSSLTEILFNETYTSSSKRLCDKILNAIIEALDTVIAGGTLALTFKQAGSSQTALASSLSQQILQSQAARNLKTKSTKLASQILYRLNVEFSRDQAQKYADEHFNKGRLSLRINEVLDRLKVEVDFDSLRKEYQRAIREEKLNLLQPDKAPQKQAQPEVGNGQAEIKSNDAKQTGVDSSLSPKSGSLPAPDPNASLLPLKVYQGIKDMLGVFFKSSVSDSVAAANDSSSLNGIAILSSAAARFVGVKPMTDSINQKVKFDVTKRYNSDEFKQLKTGVAKLSNPLSPAIDELLSFEMKWIGRLGGAVYKLSSRIVDEVFCITGDPDQAYDLAIQRARIERLAPVPHEEKIRERDERAEKDKRERLLQEAQERINCPPELLMRYQVAYSAFREQYSEEEVAQLSQALPSVKNNSTFFSKEEYAVLAKLYRQEKEAPTTFNEVQSIRRMRMSQGE